MRLGILLTCVLGGSLLGIRAHAEDFLTPDPSSQIKIDAADLSFSGPLMLANQPPSTREHYEGGRGMVSLSGVTGMFINPTSGTLDQGQLTIQYCLIINQYNAGTVVGHGLLVDYGIFDWLDVGWFTNLAQIERVNTSWCDKPIVMTGPFARVRLFKEEGWIPEVSVGGMWFDGDAPGDLLSKTELFLALSKHWAIDPNGFVKSVRVHGGYRWISRQEAPNLPKSVRLGTDLNTIYAGLEVEFPYKIFLIGEVSTPDLYNRNQNEAWPYAIGFQWRPNNVLGISIAHTNPEELGLRDAFWFGIGLNFKF